MKAQEEEFAILGKASREENVQKIQYGTSIKVFNNNVKQMIINTFLWIVTSDVEPASDWILEQGLDCYEGKGGDPIQPDPHSSSLTLQQCRAVCEQEPSCEGIIRKASDKQSSGICYRRKNLQLGKCVQDPEWDLHQKLSGMVDKISGK